MRIRILLFSSLNFKMPTKKLPVIFLQFYCLLLSEGTFTSFSKIISQKKSQSSRNQDFSYYFCLVIKGSGSGSILLTNGSGSVSRRHKKTDPTDPDTDPQHWREVWYFRFIFIRVTCLKISWRSFVVSCQSAATLVPNLGASVGS